jgi:hypothetical protein
MISTGFRRFASVLLLTLGASASFAGGFQSFADTLEKRGWHVNKDANGDLLLFPKTTAHEAADSMPRSDDRDLDALAERLGAAGWQVERSMDGSITFWAADKPGNRTQTIVESRPKDGLADLGDRLAAAGWLIERSTDGSILFWATDKHVEALESAAESRLNDGLADLGDRLAAAGWLVERSADGSILFWAAGKRGNTPEIAVESHPNARLAAFGARLAAAGWQVGNGADGSITFWATDTTNRGLANYSESTPDNWSHGTG